MGLWDTDGIPYDIDDEPEKKRVIDWSNKKGPLKVLFVGMGDRGLEMLQRLEEIGLADKSDMLVVRGKYPRWGCFPPPPRSNDDLEGYKYVLLTDKKLDDYYYS